MRKLHNITSDDHVADDWRHFIAMNQKIADFAIIATPDKLHKEPAVAFAKLGKIKTSQVQVRQLNVGLRFPKLVPNVYSSGWSKSL